MRKWRTSLTVDLAYKMLAMVIAIVFCSSCTSTRAVSTPLCSINWGSTAGLNSVKSIPALDGVYVYGNSTDSYAGTGLGGNELQRDIWISKYDMNAQLVWSKKIGTDAVDDVYQAYMLSNGNIVIIGNTFGSMYATNSGGSNVFAVSYTSSGTLTWSKQLSYPNSSVSGAILSDDKINIQITDDSGNNRLVRLSNSGSVLNDISIDSMTHPTGSTIKSAFFNSYDTVNYLYRTDVEPIGTADLKYVYHDSGNAEHTVDIPYMQNASACYGQANHTVSLDSIRMSAVDGGVNIYIKVIFRHSHSSGEFDTQITTLMNVSSAGLVSSSHLDENKVSSASMPTEDSSNIIWVGWSRVGRVFNESTSAENFLLYGTDNSEYYDQMSSYKVIQYAKGLASKVFEGDVAVNLPSDVTPTSGQLVRVGATLFWVAPVYKTVNDVDQYGVMVYKFDSIATPVYSLASGTYTGTQSVSISCATTGAQIRYTTDGSEPTDTSALYSGPISVSTNKTIKARAFVTGMVPSARADASYVIRKTISGALTLKMYSGNKSGLVATVVLRKPDGTVLQTSSAVLDSNGNYSLLTEYEGTMDMLVRVPRWLRKKSSINVTGATTCNFTLTNGDADANNSVNLFDYTVLDGAYGTRPGDSGWNQLADLDGGNTVDSFDYMIIDMYFGQQGDN